MFANVPKAKSPLAVRFVASNAFNAVDRSLFPLNFRAALSLFNFLTSQKANLPN